MRLNRPIGLSKDVIDRAGLEELREAGIEVIEGARPYTVDKEDEWTALKENTRAAGIRLWSFHLQFAPFTEKDIASLDPEIRRNAVAFASAYIRRLGELGVPNIVLHPSGEPIRDEDRPEAMKNAQESLSVLARLATAGGSTLCVEDLPRTCLGNSSSDIKQLLEADDSLRVCFDTNHLLGEDTVHFIREVGSKIRTTHISDYDRVNERHWLPGEGKIDWTAVVDAFDEVGYDGPFLYELGYKAPKSIIRDRDLTPADFVRNYHEIHDRKPITVLGKPIDNLPFWCL